MNSPHYYLGLGGANHDFSACLLKNGKIEVAIEQERIDRIKHSANEWHRDIAQDAITYCMKFKSIQKENIQTVFHSNDIVALPKIFDSIKAIPIGHHLAHAACTYYQSPFKEAAILIIDGHGSAVDSANGHDNRETISHGIGRDGKIFLEPVQTGRKRMSSASWTYITHNSLGSFYKVISDLIGFGMRGTGKTMGLAAFGTARFLMDLKQFAFPLENGGFHFNPYGGIVEYIKNRFDRSQNVAQTAADIACAAQIIFEDAVINSARVLKKESGLKLLCYGGGCALNGLANQRIMEKTGFESVYIFPACGDAGLAFGAVMWGWYNNVANKKWRPVEQSQVGFQAFTGKQYTQDEIETALNRYPVLFNKPADPIKLLVGRLLDGQVGAIFIGGSEIGPRSLGHRSIVADPGAPGIKKKINNEIKHRESFRPLAPVVPLENTLDYFIFDGESPFMLRIASVRGQWREKISGAIHADGTARLQTLRESVNPLLFKLLKEFGKKSGYAILINTSFNRKDEPIIETPEQALEGFIKMRLDFLYLDGFIVEKHSPWISTERE